MWSARSPRTSLAGKGFGRAGTRPTAPARATSRTPCGPAGGPGPAGRVTAMDPTRLPARRGRALAAATTPDRVRRLREVAASAARGDSLLLCAEPRDPTRRAATATANLATLAAFTLAYATGLPV